MPSGLENKLCAADWIWENWSRVFPDRFKKIDREHHVYGDIVPTDERMGWAIDFVADFQTKRYLIEVDINNSSRDVWHGYKIFGYRAAYCIDRNIRIGKVGVMIFAHDRVYNPRVRNMLAVSGLEYCMFREDKGSWWPTKTSLW